MVRPAQKLIRKGFTLIEIMFAIGLIALLATILFLGGNAIMGGAKEKSTKVTMAALKGMLGEYDAKTRLGRSPRRWSWSDGSDPLPVPTTAAPNNAADFWRLPYRITGNPARDPDALDAPGFMGDEVVRNVSRQVLNTQLAMGLILQMPANRAALSKLPPEQYFIPVATTGSIRSPGSDGVLASADTGTESIFYPAGVQIVVRDTTGSTVQEKRFICTDPGDGTSTLPTIASSGPPWTPDNGPANPVLLDGWGNPIIFVPATGLRVLLLNGESDYKPNDIKQVMIIVSPEGKVQKALPTDPPRVAQAGRPFFASAGPDGDFSRGDDNIYSFEP